MARIGSRYGAVWQGMARSGLVWFGKVWIMVRLGSAEHDKVWFGTAGNVVRMGMDRGGVGQGLVRLGLVRTVVR